MNLDLNFQEAELTTFLETSIIKKQILKRITLFALIMVFLLLAKVNIFIFLMLLVAPPIYIMTESFRLSRRVFFPSRYGLLFQMPGQSQTWEEVIFDKQALDANAISTILPTIFSTYHNLSLIKRLLIYIGSFIFLVPVGAVLSNEIPIIRIITLCVYLFIFIRYIRCLQKLPLCKISISNEALMLPILGFFKLYYRKISFEDIKKVEIITYPGAILKKSIFDIMKNSNKRSIHGITIWHNKSKATLSTATVNFDFLYQLIEQFQQSTVQIIQLKI